MQRLRHASQTKSRRLLRILLLRLGALSTDPGPALRRNRPGFFVAGCFLRSPHEPSGHAFGVPKDKLSDMRGGSDPDIASLIRATHANSKIESFAFRPGQRTHRLV